MSKIKLNIENSAFFKNNVDYCVGTGRMGLALHKEYHDQLAYVQKGIGFKYIRGHGLFCDDMAIYQERTDREGNTTIEYNFTYLDRVFDDYLSLNIRPFLELGFMPYAMKSQENYVFHWKGNTSPPKDYELWCDMVKATLRHLIDRYGEDEVLNWPIEVWNEPNLWGFWYKADMEEYFKLYTYSANAVKEVDERLKVGGPAICGGADEKWMRGFLNYCRENKPPLDFITRHHYTTHFPKPQGHYGYASLMGTREALDTLKNVKAMISEYDEFKDLPFYITEFNTSYIPNCPMHDTNENAVELARTLSEIGDYVDGYSYWTFGDVFEEQGVPFSLFHGGFGMLADRCIPKPTYWTFKFFKDVKGECIYRGENAVVTKQADGSLKGVLWNVTRDSNTEALELGFETNLPEGEYVLITKTVDEGCCNPLKTWHDMGEKKMPKDDEIEIIRASANPLIKTARVDGTSLDFKLGKNAMVYFELKKAPIQGDRGYDYDRVAMGENAYEVANGLVSK